MNTTPLTLISKAAVAVAAAGAVARVILSKSGSASAVTKRLDGALSALEAAVLPGAFTDAQDAFDQIEVAAVQAHQIAREAITEDAKKRRARANGLTDDAQKDSEKAAELVKLTWGTTTAAAAVAAAPIAAAKAAAVAEAGRTEIADIDRNLAILELASACFTHAIAALEVRTAARQAANPNPDLDKSRDAKVAACAARVALVEQQA